MKNKNTIQMDFSRAYDDAKRVDEIAKKLKQLSKTNLEESMQNLASAWKGDSAVSFIRKEQQLQQEIKSTADNLNQIAEDIRRVAKRVYHAEMLAYKIAIERTTSSGGSVS